MSLTPWIDKQKKQYGVKFDLPAVWERKRATIEQTPGLSVWRGSETFAQDVKGCANIETLLTDLANGPEPYRAVIYIDEVEKHLAGTGTDLSGTTTEMTGTLLSHLQDTQASGLILIGPPGTGKSLIAKASGTLAGVPTISFDLSGMKRGIVGESGATLRKALAIVEAVSQDKALWIATCNSIGSLPAPLLDRFTLGTYFVDLPDAEARAQMWTLYRTRYSVTDDVIPPDEGWNGREISACCRNAYRLRCTLKEAARYIVPISVSDKDGIEQLRFSASGKYISAAHPGLYTYDPGAQARETVRQFRTSSGEGPLTLQRPTSTEN